MRSRLLTSSSRLLPVLILTTVILQAVIPAGPALAQGYPVIDQAAVAQATQTLQQAAQQVQQLNSMLGQLQAIGQALGKQGLPNLNFTAALGANGISQYAPPIASLLASTQQQGSSLSSLLSQAGALTGRPAASATPDFSSFQSAQNWVNGALTVPAGASVTAVDLTRKARGLLAQEAAADAYALAVSTRGQLSQVTQRSGQLAQEAAAATDLRGDIAANTAVMLAMHDEMTRLQALLAAVLEVESAGRLAGSDPHAPASVQATAQAAGGNGP